MSIDSSKRDIKSYFSTHYGSGSGSEDSADDDTGHGSPPTAADPDHDLLNDTEDGKRADAEDGITRLPEDNFSDEEMGGFSCPEEFHRTLSGRNPDEIRLPARNKGPADILVVEKLQRLKHTKDTQNLDMKYEIQKRKDFRNPSIYEKLIDHCGIREFGSNFPTDVFDADSFDASSYYEELSKAQKVLLDSISDKEKESHPKVEIIHATAKKSLSASNPIPGDPMRKKRSKWDEGPAPKRLP